MGITIGEASAETPAAAFDTVARSLHDRLPRRRVAGLLAAALATSIFGISNLVDAGATRRKRGKRRGGRHGRPAVQAQKSIPPNCIYVCCDGTCDSWTMCFKCVKWPEPTTTAIAS